MKIIKNIYTNTMFFKRVSRSSLKVTSRQYIHEFERHE